MTSSPAPAVYVMVRQQFTRTQGWINSVPTETVQADTYGEVLDYIRSNKNVSLRSVRYVVAATYVFESMPTLKGESL